MPNKSRNELMGGKGHAAKARDLTLDDLPELLGERCPKIEHTRVGRLRLLTALRSRFGDNYTHLPGISNILQEFDKEAQFRVKIEEMKMLRAKGKT
jgi:hypothetical protein